MAISSESLASTLRLHLVDLYRKSKNNLPFRRNYQIPTCQSPPIHRITLPQLFSPFSAFFPSSPESSPTSFKFSSNSNPHSKTPKSHCLIHGIPPIPYANSLVLPAIPMVPLRESSFRIRRYRGFFLWSQYASLIHWKSSLLASIPCTVE